MLGVALSNKKEHEQMKSIALRQLEITVYFPRVAYIVRQPNKKKFNQPLYYFKFFCEIKLNKTTQLSCVFFLPEEKRRNTPVHKL